MAAHMPRLATTRNTRSPRRRGAGGGRRFWDACGPGGEGGSVRTELVMSKDARSALRGGEYGRPPSPAWGHPHHRRASTGPAVPGGGKGEGLPAAGCRGQALSVGHTLKP